MEMAPCQFETIWTLYVKNFEFKTQIDGDSLTALQAAADALIDTKRNVAPHCHLQLTRAEMCFSTFHEPTGVCDALEGDYEEIFESFVGLSDTVEGAQNVQHYLNYITGGYDRVMNRVTPSDFGITFPDGSVRVMWDEDECIWGFDEAYTRFGTFLTVLMEMSRHNYFNATDDELNSGESMAEHNRKMDFLRTHGLLPNDDGEWVEMAKLDVIQAAIDALPESA